MYVQKMSVRSVSGRESTKVRKYESTKVRLSLFATTFYRETSSYTRIKSFAGSFLPAEQKSITDQPTDKPTDGRTHPFIESWLTTKKLTFKPHQKYSFCIIVHLHIHVLGYESKSFSFQLVIKIMVHESS